MHQIARFGHIFGIGVCIFILGSTSLFAAESPLLHSDNDIESETFNFYSKIDTDESLLANTLTSRHLQDFPTFRGFGKACRETLPWLDTEKMNEELLQELTKGTHKLLMQVINKKNINISASEFKELTYCLKETYTDMQDFSVRQQEALETAGSSSVYMDGSLENSDYDLVQDLHAIHEVLFKNPPQYRGPENPTAQSVKDYLEYQGSLPKGTGDNKDFYDTPKCDGIFCITLRLVKGSKHGGGKRGGIKSIEELVEQHSDMINPVSWSDLGGHKMTQNFFQLPFLVKNFSSKVAGGFVMIRNRPQQTKKFETEDTKLKKETQVENAYRCALIDQGLPLDELKSAGITGAGYMLDQHNVLNVSNAMSPLNPLDKDRLKSSNDCKNLHRDFVRNQDADLFVKQIIEMQAYTSNLINIILNIMDVEKKLDKVEVQ